ncbi:MAG: ketoacyl-ACP synthase III [Bacteroidia bacterium]|nr:ketoacyl-ACP synthase III [Bacteroidia bacterium]
MGLFIDKIRIHLPEEVLSNTQLAKEFNITEAEILKRTGIEKRYLAAKNETASDLAFVAAKKILASDPDLSSKIDFLIFCSDCFDYIAPATSCILQDRLKLPQTTACIDLPYGCSGFVYGLGIANGLLHSGMAKTILFLTCDSSTKTLNPKNFEQRSLFSDGAAAILLSKNDSTPANNFVFGTDGSGAHDLYIEGSAFRTPLDENFKKESCVPYGEMVMNGANIFSFALKIVPTLINDALKKCNLTFEDIDLFIFHQANGFILETLRRKMNIPKEKFYTNIKDYGNTVASTIPIALYTAEQEKVLKKGMKVLIAGFGVGNSWAATVINY